MAVPHNSPGDWRNVATGSTYTGCTGTTTTTTPSQWGGGVAERSMDLAMAITRREAKAANTVVGKTTHGNRDGINYHLSRSKYWEQVYSYKHGVTTLVLNKKMVREHLEQWVEMGHNLTEITKGPRPFDKIFGTGAYMAYFQDATPTDDWEPKRKGSVAAMVRESFRLKEGRSLVNQLHYDFEVAHKDQLRLVRL